MKVRTQSMCSADDLFYVRHKLLLAIQRKKRIDSYQIHLSWLLKLSMQTILIWQLSTSENNGIHGFSYIPTGGHNLSSVFPNIIIALLQIKSLDLQNMQFCPSVVCFLITQQPRAKLRNLLVIPNFFSRSIRKYSWNWETPEILKKESLK